MFHFPAFPLTALCIQAGVPTHDCWRVTPFGHPGITARLTAPPGLSRPPTSFIGSWYQGIHHLPYTTSTHAEILQEHKRSWKVLGTQISQINKMLASTMHISTNNQPPPQPPHPPQTFEAVYGKDVIGPEKTSPPSGQSSPEVCLFFQISNRV